MKVCSKCGAEKPLKDFLKNKSCKDGRAGVCYECDAKYKKEYYARNRKHKQALANKLNQDKKKYWVERFGGKCLDCDGIFHPCAFDFHHLEGKDANPSKAITWKIERAEKEMNKCVLLCANCHRIRHFAEKEV